MTRAGRRGRADRWASVRVLYSPCEEHSSGRPPHGFRSATRVVQI